MKDVEELSAAGATAWRKNVFASTHVGVYFQSPEGLIPVIVCSTARAVDRTMNFPAEYEMHLVEAIERIGLERAGQTIR